MGVVTLYSHIQLSLPHTLHDVLCYAGLKRWQNIVPPQRTRPYSKLIQSLEQRPTEGTLGILRNSLSLKDFPRGGVEASPGKGLLG